MNTKQRAFVASGAVAALAFANSLSAQVIVSEQFNYADQAALDVNWNLGANNTLTLNPGTGDASIAGSGTNPNTWAGSTFSLTPTDASPIRLTADISTAGNAGTVGTVGLRQAGGTSPLFEMGMYRVFDNIQSGPDSATPGSGSGFGVRTISLGTDLGPNPNQDWVKMGDYYNGTARFEATFTTFGVTTRVDLGIDGTWDFSYAETGTTATGAFGDLRVHSPAASSPLSAGGITVDNITLEVIPEPSTYALLGIGAAALAFRRRKA